MAEEGLSQGPSEDDTFGAPPFREWAATAVERRFDEVVGRFAAMLKDAWKHGRRVGKREAERDYGAPQRARIAELEDALRYCLSEAKAEKAWKPAVIDRASAALREGVYGRLDALIAKEDERAGHQVSDSREGR